MSKNWIYKIDNMQEYTLEDNTIVYIPCHKFYFSEYDDAADFIDTIRNTKKFDSWSRVEEGGEWAVNVTELKYEINFDSFDIPDIEDTYYKYKITDILRLFECSDSYKQNHMILINDTLFEEIS